ncbi:50S ribosomal protein L1 isoform X2 [Leptopilina heterotoma]|nr:50S ribosomal protein L1 isoform X2 [Leptopilina heterotoma]
MLSSLSKVAVEPSIYGGFLLQNRNYALRIGTRERKLKQKLRNIAAKRSKELKKPPKKVKAELIDVHKYPLADNRVSPDNVWIQKYYTWKTYSFEEAVQCNREVFHPTVYDIPDAKLTAVFEINMKGPSKSKKLNTFNSLVSIPHSFKLEAHRTIMAIAGTPEQQQEARNAGAHIVIGPEIVRLIKIGEVNVADYDDVIAHPQMLSHILSIKGVLKLKFPTLKQGTLGDDLNALIYKHLHGIRYTCTGNPNYTDFGHCEVPFGRLNMSTPQLKENLKSVVDDLLKRKPKISEPMILRMRLKCSPNREVFKLDLGEFIEEEKKRDSYDEDDDDDDDNDTVARAEI